MHVINAILNHIEKQPKIKGRFSHGETLQRRRGDSISMGETLFRYSLRGETSFQPRRESISGETLLRDTGTSLFTGTKSIGSGQDPESQAGRQSDGYGGRCLELRRGGRYGDDDESG